MVTRKGGKMAQKQSKIQFTQDELQEYISHEVADFVRDSMFELEHHPMDYQDHYEYIRELYIKKSNEGTEDI